MLQQTGNGEGERKASGWSCGERNSLPEISQSSKAARGGFVWYEAQSDAESVTEVQVPPSSLWQEGGHACDHPGSPEEILPFQITGWSAVALAPAVGVDAQTRRAPPHFLQGARHLQPIRDRPNTRHNSAEWAICDLAVISPSPLQQRMPDCGERLSEVVLFSVSSSQKRLAFLFLVDLFPILPVPCYTDHYGLHFKPC